MAKPATKQRFQDRAASRRSALLYELSLVFEFGDGPSMLAADGPGRDSIALAGATMDVAPESDEKPNRLMAPDELITRAAPGFTRFRRDLEQMERDHRRACLAAREATRSVTSSADLPNDVDGFADLLSSVSTTLASWKLASPTGQGPLIGPFTAAFVRGVCSRVRWPIPLQPGLLMPIPNMGNGDALALLVFWHRRSSRVPATQIVQELQLSLPGPGSGRTPEQPQLRDAQMWAIHRIGGVPIRLIVEWLGTSHQRIGRVLDEEDTALKNGLPIRRPDAARTSS